MDNLEQVRQVREEIAKHVCNCCLGGSWEGCGLLAVIKPCLAAKHYADSILSTPILERTCPECEHFMKEYDDPFPCKSCSTCHGSGKVPFTVGDAINKAIEELK